MKHEDIIGEPFYLLGICNHAKLLYFILIYLFQYFIAHVQLQYKRVWFPIKSVRIPEIDIAKLDSNSDTFDYSYLDPLIAVANIDIFFVEEGLDVNLM